MKKYIFIFLLAAAGLEAQSQILISLLLGDKLNSDGLEFGLDGGANFSNIAGLDAKKIMTTFNLGFYFDIRLKKQWNMYTGLLLKSNMGQDKLSDNDISFLQTPIYLTDGSYQQKISYFIVPALIKYKFKKHFYVEAGPQFGLMYKAWVEYNSDVDGSEARIRNYNTEKIHRMDAGVAAGLGYQLMKGKGVSLGLKYYYGLLDVYKDRSGTNNCSLFVKVTVPIGANKKNQKEKETVIIQP